MYNGDVTITGNSYIKPYDVVHLIDMTNGMDGSFEVGRVIHTLSPMTGFTTKIKPDLIVNQKNRFNADEICIASKMMHESFVRAMVQAGVGSLFLGIGGFVAQGAGMGFLTTLLSRLSFFTAFALVGYNGYKAIKNHHERIITIMNNTIGRDSLELMPLMYRNMPYVAGIDGVQKDSYLRHMHSAAIDDTGKVSIWERMGYANSPIEFEYYNKVVGDSGLASLMQTMLGFGFGPGAEGQGGPGMLEAMRRSF
jgi:hypothetical protein